MPSRAFPPLLSLIMTTTLALFSQLAGVDLLSAVTSLGCPGLSTLRSAESWILKGCCGPEISLIDRCSVSGSTDAQPWLSGPPLERHKAGSSLLPMSDVTMNEPVTSYILLGSLPLFCSFGILVQAPNSLSLWY